MDREITVRLYEVVSDDGDARAEVETVLAHINGLDKRDRERDVGDEIVIRLEALGRQANGLLHGDFTRVQTHNLPGHVTDDDTDRLPVDEIGHNVSFAYDPESGALALQFDIRMGVSRICRYLSEFSEDLSLTHMPILTSDALARFRRETPKKLELRVSNIRNFQDIEGDKTDFETTLEDWGDSFNGDAIEITISTRGSERSLSSAPVFNLIRRFLNLRGEIGGISKIKAYTIESDEAFNFIKELVKEREVLDLPDNDPQRGRELRIGFSQRVLNENLTYVRRVCG